VLYNALKSLGERTIRHANSSTITQTDSDWIGGSCGITVDTYGNIFVCERFGVDYYVTKYDHDLDPIVQYVIHTTCDDEYYCRLFICG